MKAVVPLDGSDTAMGIMPTVRRLLGMAPRLKSTWCGCDRPEGRAGAIGARGSRAACCLAGKTTVHAPPPRLVESHGEAMARKGRELQEALEAIAKKELSEAVAVSHVKWSGNAAQAITELANELDADVIVMATHGRSGLSHVLAGSVAEAVIRTSGRPVLVQKPD